MNLPKHILTKVESALKSKIVSVKNLKEEDGHHQIFLLQTDNKKYILKLNGENHLKHEYKMLKLIPKGIAPKPIYLSKAEPIIFIQEFVEGKTPKKIDDSFIKDMAKTYKKLHANKTSRIPAKERKLMHSLSYHLEYKKNKLSNINPSEAKTKLESLYNHIKPVIDKYDPSFIDRKTFSLCHNDANLANIFITQNGYRFIDWEFSGYWLHERELINFIKSNNLNSNQEKLFLTTYGYKPSNKFYALYLIFLFGDCIFLLSQRKVNPKRMNKLVKEINGIFNKIK